MSNQNDIDPARVDLAKTMSIIDRAAHELCRADRAVKEAFEEYQEKVKWRAIADTALARLAPWSAESQLFAVEHFPYGAFAISIQGSPDEDGEDCYVLPLQSIQSLAETKIARDTPADPEDNTSADS